MSLKYVRHKTTEDPRKFQDHVRSHMESAPCQEAITSSKSSKQDSISFVPKTINLVLSGLIRSELLKHQLRIEVKCCCKSVIDVSLSLTLKDKYIFVSYA